MKVHGREIRGKDRPLSEAVHFRPAISRRNIFKGVFAFINFVLAWHIINWKNYSLK